MSTFTSPLRDLLKVDAEWIQDENHRQDKPPFHEVKDLVAAMSVLKLFDSTSPVVISVDASPFGLGAVVLQKGQPGEFASRTLSGKQKRYAQIEKELLAVQFGMQHFHHYVYGNQVTVETDHKPLVGIVEKPKSLCTPRIQRMCLQLQSSSYTLVCKTGKEMFLADTLSRAPEPREYSKDRSQCHEERINAMLSYVVPEQSSRDKYAVATKADPTLQLVWNLVNQGQPEHKRDCPAPAKPFWDVRNDFSTTNDLLLRGHQVVIPISLQGDMLKKIHDGHFGETKSIEREKNVEQIRNLVVGCGLCQERINQNCSVVIPWFQWSYRIIRFNQWRRTSLNQPASSICWLFTTSETGPAPCNSKRQHVRQSSSFGLVVVSSSQRKLAIHFRGPKISDRRQQQSRKMSTEQPGESIVSPGVQINP